MPSVVRGCECGGGGRAAPWATSRSRSRSVRRSGRSRAAAARGRRPGAGARQPGFRVGFPVTNGHHGSSHQARDSGYPAAARRALNLSIFIAAMNLFRFSLPFAFFAFSSTFGSAFQLQSNYVRSYVRGQSPPFLQSKKCRQATSFAGIRLFRSSSPSSFSRREKDAERSQSIFYRHGIRLKDLDNAEEEDDLAKIAKLIEESALTEICWQLNFLRVSHQTGRATTSILLRCRF